MAMTMIGEIQLAAPREAVWEKLNDPDVLKACIKPRSSRKLLQCP
jgi:carbon monoxide dehydrogenase subunit G